MSKPYSLPHKKSASDPGKPSLFLAATIIALLISEWGLRTFMHITPGIHTYSDNFKYVDSLVLLKGLYADSDGILKIAPEAGREIERNLRRKLNDGSAATVDERTCLTEVYTLFQDYAQLSDTNFKNAFSEMLRALKKKGAQNQLDSLIIKYSLNPINEDGFRSISLIPVTGVKKKKILLLGDSFTWGHSTENKTNSFADILLAKGYAVYNTGISGADPTQYLAIAKKYIPLLKPDYVIVNFFLGNDVMYFRREALPGVPIFYSTNAGALLSCPEGVYLGSPEETYQFNKDRYRIPAEKNLFNNFCSKTALGTVLWMAAYKMKFKYADPIPSDFVEYQRKVAKIQTFTPYSDLQIDSIRTIAEQTGSKFILVAIPNLYNNKLYGVSQTPHLFDSLTYYTSPVPALNYDISNGHFNDTGHRQYALFLDSLLRTM